jgi:cell division protein FtsI/penicillin-binding protein 2
MVARRIPKGSVYDRNGIPLATSRWEELEEHRSQYEQLGIALDEACAKSDERHYPFGSLTFHLLGDRRTRFNWTARSTSYVERDSRSRLLGYDDHAKDVEVRQPNGETNWAVQLDYSDLVPLLRYRYRPDHEAAQRILNRDRNVRMSVDIALQQQVAAILKEKIVRAKKERGAAVVMDADTGDLLAAASYPAPDNLRLLGTAAEEDGGDEADLKAKAGLKPHFDRARWGIYPPGSTFKIVTSIAAFRKNPRAMEERFLCKPLGGRQGNYVRGRAIYDDETDGASGHHEVAMEKGIIESCNAYFAQLAVERIGADSLYQTARLLGIGFTDARESLEEKLRSDLPQAAFGQGIVYATPFQMARVAATVANDGKMPYGRWVTDDSNQRTREPVQVISRDQADFLSRAMRGVVLHGTARKSLSNSPIPIAGKTGTAQVGEGKASHSWFIGFAPYGAESKSCVAFSVIVENGGYGGKLAAPIAGEIAAAALAVSALGGRNGNPR